MSFFALIAAYYVLTMGKRLKKIPPNLQVYYALLDEINPYQTRNKNVRLRFSQSGIFAYIAPRCRSPPLSFRFQQTPKSKGRYNHEKNKLKRLL